MSSNGQNGTGDRERYQQYLCSREWGLLREQVRQRCGGICERCHDGPMQNVHHLTYARKYHEHLVDLQGLCEPCHQFTHGRLKEDPWGHQAYLTGLLSTRSRYFAFFELSKDGFTGFPDDEVFWTCWHWNFTLEHSQMFDTNIKECGNCAPASYVGKPYLVQVSHVSVAFTNREDEQPQKGLRQVVRFRPDPSCDKTLDKRLTFAFAYDFEPQPVQIRTKERDM